MQTGSCLLHCLNEWQFLGEHSSVLTGQGFLPHVVKPLVSTSSRTLVVGVFCLGFFSLLVQALYKFASMELATLYLFFNNVIVP